jgi:porphobilinogen deaminase
MAESALRRRKKQAQNARWKRMKPAERLRRASEITAAGFVLRSAGLARLGLSRAEISKIERSRGV